MNAGEGAREFRELLDPLALKAGAVERNDLEDEAVDILPDPMCLRSLLSRVTGPDHSLSVAGVLTESSRSSMLLLLPRPLDEAEPETRL